jgi:hypothetical protein
MRKHRAARWAGLAALFLLALTGGAQAQQAGVVTHLSGILSVKRADAPSKVLSVKSEIREGDLLSTEDEAYARIKFADSSEIVLRPNSQLKVESYAFNQAKPEADNVMISMLKGGLRAVTGLIGKRNREKVNFSTATATIGIRGTHFGALLCNNDCTNIPTISGHPPGNGLHTDTAQGSTVISNAAGTIEVPAGSFSYTPSPTAAPRLVPPSQGIQVTMPPNISQNRGGGQGIGKGKEGECAL